MFDRVSSSARDRRVRKPMPVPAVLWATEKTKLVVDRSTTGSDEEQTQ